MAQDQITMTVLLEYVATILDIFEFQREQIVILHATFGFLLGVDELDVRD